MSRQFLSLLIKSARIQRAIEAEHRRRTTDWIRLMRLKVLRLRITNRIARIAATARERSLPAMVPGSVPALAGHRPRERGRAG